MIAGVGERNVVMWMDHRAAEQASRITATKHRVLQGVGGVMSPEMQPPKLLWLKEVRRSVSHTNTLFISCFNPLLFILSVESARNLLERSGTFL